MSHRPERLAEAIKKEVSDMIRDELKDPRIGFATITSVDVSGDMRYAKIFISVFGEPEAQQKTIDALESARGFVRSELGRRIRLRYTPELSFKLDSSIQRGTRVIKLLDEVSGDGDNAEGHDDSVG